jgi:hypothetical protein
MLASVQFACQRAGGDVIHLESDTANWPGTCVRLWDNLVRRRDGAAAYFL